MPRRVAPIRRLDEPFVAAASGLVRDGDSLWVVSDDRPLLARFPLDGGPGEAHVLAGDPVPDDPRERKAAKPDLECLARLPDGSLLTLGSGSTDRRERGWIFDGAAREVSLSALYAALRREVDDLNIEGAAVVGDRLWLAQRGNGAAGSDALIELDLAGWHSPGAVRSVTPIDLGDIDGIPLTLSDLSPEPDGRLRFSAIAEDTQNTYLDGECVGAALGVLDPLQAVVHELELLEEAWKIEGVSTAGDGSLLLVADDDDPATPAPVLVAHSAVDTP